MSCAVPFNTEPHPQGLARGDVVLVGASAKAELVDVARAAGRLVVELVRPGPAQRGRLGLFVEDAIEQTLSAHGASPPGVGASCNLDASLSDQLFRARLIKKSGLTLAFASLDGIANLAGALDAEDSAVLRWWMRATHERPVQLLFEWRDRFMGVYVAPTSLENLIEHGPEWVPPQGALPHGSEPPAASAELAASLAAMQLGLAVQVPELAETGAETAPAEPPASTDEASFEPPPCAMVAFDDVAAPPPDPLETAEEAPWTDLPETPSPSLAEAMANALADDEPEPPSRSPELHAVAVETPEAHAQLLPPPMLAPPELSPEAPAVVSLLPPVTDLSHAVIKSSGRKPRPVANTRKPPAVAVRAAPEAPVTRPTATRAPSPEECAALIRELEAARGPKPLAVIERLFVSAYVPLSEAVAAGLTDPRARAALDTWATSFDKSYRDAFDALRLRGKRPTMVLDVPDVALRIGRLHGARSTQLVLVDAMRFDLGMRVQDRLREALGQQAALTERLLLWSALPSTTATQLELIGRGPAGLRDMSDSVDSEPPVARGRGASTLRRVRAGNREVFKLDLVEARLSEPGPALGVRLDALADEAAAALAGHFMRLPPRTLVMTFGDHGFVVDDLEEGTSSARQGGAAPEQVLVPAFAWIVGPVH